jgi:putative restriction endonuclease
VKRRSWTREELLVGFNLYCQLPFGQLHRHNPRIIELAKLIDRTASSVAMKLVNFASLDPTHRSRGISGLKNVSATDRAIWDEFNQNWEGLAAESELALQALRAQRGMAKETSDTLEVEPATVEWGGEETEVERVARARLGQSFFRRVVLASYGGQCCICRLPVRALLVASHIVPWSADPSLRVNPRNGLCLCAMHDRAFDRGLITIDADFTLCVGSEIRSHASQPIVAANFLAYAGSRVQHPEKFRPSDEYCAYHREHVFSG